MDDELVPYEIGPACQPSGEPFRNAIPRRHTEGRAVSWLREVIEGDRAAALAATPGLNQDR
jgi:hypothetical protein